MRRYYCFVVEGMRRAIRKRRTQKAVIMKATLPGRFRVPLGFRVVFTCAASVNYKAAQPFSSQSLSLSLALSPPLSLSFVLFRSTHRLLMHLSLHTCKHVYIVLSVLSFSIDATQLTELLKLIGGM